jgi:hypothetical protein
MKKPPESHDNPDKLALEAGQGELLCGYDGSCHAPSFSYEQAISADGENRISKAFDILFQEVMRIRKSKKNHEISSHIRQGFDRPAGGGTNR